jgi:hypothetical protein
MRFNTQRHKLDQVHDGVLNCLLQCQPLVAHHEEARLERLQISREDGMRSASSSTMVTTHRVRRSSDAMNAAPLPTRARDAAQGINVVDGERDIVVAEVDERAEVCEVTGVVDGVEGEGNACRCAPSAA